MSQYARLCFDGHDNELWRAAAGQWFYILQHVRSSQERVSLVYGGVLNPASCNTRNVEQHARRTDHAADSERLNIKHFFCPQSDPIGSNTDFTFALRTKNKYRRRRHKRQQLFGYGATSLSHRRQCSHLLPSMMAPAGSGENSEVVLFLFFPLLTAVASASRAPPRLQGG